MHSIRLSDKARLAFSSTSVINIEVAKTANSFMTDQDKYLNNKPFCHSYSI